MPIFTWEVFKWAAQHYSGPKFQTPTIPHKIRRGSELTSIANKTGSTIRLTILWRNFWNSYVAQSGKSPIFHGYLIWNIRRNLHVFICIDIHLLPRAHVGWELHLEILILTAWVACLDSLGLLHLGLLPRKDHGVKLLQVQTPRSIEA